jgi:MFS family permease
VSSYIESALHIDKAVGDLLGLAGFAILLGLARISYAKWGKNISAVLLIGMIGAAVCYCVAGVSPHAVPALIACIFAGLFTGMLWPGTLILMEEKIPSPSVAAYALMAAGGDLGASFAPQLMGAVVDKVAASGFATELGAKLGFSAEQIGMKTGMLITSIFPILGVIVVLIIISYFKKHPLKEEKTLLSVTEKGI